MTKNTLSDLNDHLFSQLETLSNPSLKGDQLKEEIERSKAVTSVAGKVIENANLVFEAHKFKVDFHGSGPLPVVIGHDVGRNK